MPRHKFIPILKSSPDGVYGICEYCGVPNNSGVLGCIVRAGTRYGIYYIYNIIHIGLRPLQPTPLKRLWNPKRTRGVRPSLRLAATPNL